MSVMVVMGENNNMRLQYSGIVRLYVYGGLWFRYFHFIKRKTFDDQSFKGNIPSSQELFFNTI